MTPRDLLLAPGRRRWRLYGQLFALRAQLTTFRKGTSRAAPVSNVEELHPPLRRVLVCDTRVPAPDRDAGSLRMYWILRLLRELGCQVTVFPLDRSYRDQYGADLEQLGIEVHHGGSSFRRFARCRAGLYDLIILSRPQGAAATIDSARKYFPRATLVYDTVDLSFLRRQRQRALASPSEGSYIDHAGTRELELMRASDIVAAVTNDEADVIVSRLPQTSVTVLPTVHVEEPGVPEPFDRRRGLLFVGNFRHAPNVDGVIWFVNEVFPLIRSSLDVGLTVVGTDPPTAVRHLSRDDIDVTGYVPDVAPYLASARVFVSPLRFGAGMKGKNGQAMAHGLPLVTTTIGAEGMHLVDGDHALIRDTPEAFARAVIDLHTRPDVWSHISGEARALAARLWSPEAMAERLTTLVTG